MKQILADSGSEVIARDGSYLVFVDRELRGIIIGLFVTGLLGFIFSVNSIVMGISALTGKAPLSIAIVLLGMACASITAFVLLFRYYRKQKKMAIDTFLPLIVIDLANGWLLNGSKQPLAPLSHVSFVPAMQLTSSSRALYVHWPQGKMLVFRGNPFTMTTITEAQEALRALGLHA